MARQKRSLIDYKPDIRYQKPRVSGDPKITARIENAPSPEEEKRQQEYQQLLDDALQTDQLLEELRGEIENQLQSMSLPIDGQERPSLAEAVRLLNNGNDATAIDYQVFDKAVRILNNAFVIQYGFDPSQLLFTQPGPEGYKVPRVNFPDNMSCDDVANLNLSQMQSPSETQTLESIIEQRQRVTRFSLLKMLWRMLLGFVFQFMANLLKKSKLEKVPIAGRVVKRMRKKLEKKAEQLLNWVQNGEVFKWDGGEGFDDPDISGLMEGAVTQSGNQALNCVHAATEVVNYAIHWATYTPTIVKNQVEANQVNPQAILLRVMLEHQQAAHEATKFNLDLIVPDTEDTRQKREQLQQNTLKHPSMANRYFNRSIIDIRKGK